MKTKLLKKIRHDLRIVEAFGKYYLQYLDDAGWRNIGGGTLSECISQRHSYMKHRLIQKGYVKIIG